MNIRELFQDKYTVIFLLVIVLLLSVWVSRTYRNGGFSSWIAPSEGYGTWVIEGLAVSPLTSLMTLPYDRSQLGSASQGELILNRCEFVQRSSDNPKSTMKYSFVFTTTGSGLTNFEYWFSVIMNFIIINICLIGIYR